MQKISSTTGGLVGPFDNGDYFGYSASGVGDTDGDGGSNRGAAHVLFFNPNETVKSQQKLSSTQGGLAAALDNNDVFGYPVSGIGDLDGDGAIHLAVGAGAGDDDGALDRGAVYILGLTPLVDSDGDGLWDFREDANTDADNNPATSPGPDTDGDALPNYLDADDDGDTILTSAEDADPNADGDPRDARDTDRTDNRPGRRRTEDLIDRGWSGRAARHARLLRTSRCRCR